MNSKSLSLAKNFSRFVAECGPVFSGLKDKFFYARLEGKLTKLTYSVFEVLGATDDKNLPSRILNLNSTLDEYLELIEILSHLNIVTAYKSARIIYSGLCIKKSILEIMAYRSNPAEDKKEANPVIISGHGADFRPQIQNSGLRPNQFLSSKNGEAILSLIKNSPGIRSRDITVAMKPLSDRTIKRNLKHLIDAGMITREEKEQAVYYYPGA